mgnify:CR=1 FL=1
MNIKQLQILDAVVRFGSYRKAAAHLRCSQSTITFQLKNLENSLGCFLFEKAGRHMVLTPAGRTALKEAQKISYVPVCQLSKGIYLFKQKFHFLIRLLKAIRRITDQDSFKGTGLK